MSAWASLTYEQVLRELLDLLGLSVEVLVASSADEGMGHAYLKGVLRRGEDSPVWAREKADEAIMFHVGEDGYFVLYRRPSTEGRDEHIRNKSGKVISRMLSIAQDGVRISVWHDKGP